MRLPKNICDLLFSHDSYSKDYLFEIFAYLNVDEYLSLAGVNKFMYHFISSPEVWQILADKNIQSASHTIQQRYEWHGIPHTEYFLFIILLNHLSNKPKTLRGYFASNGRMVAIANEFSISVYDTTSAEGTFMTSIPYTYTPQSTNMLHNRVDIVLTMDDKHLIFMESLVSNYSQEYCANDRRIHIYETANIRKGEKFTKNHSNHIIIDVLPIMFKINTIYHDLIYDESLQRIELVGIEFNTKRPVCSYYDLNTDFGKSTVLTDEISQILINKVYVSWLTESSVIRIFDRSLNILAEVKDPLSFYGGYYLSENKLVTFPKTDTTKSMLVCSVHKMNMKQGKLTVSGGILLFDEQMMSKCSLLGVVNTKLMPLDYSESICFLLQNGQDPYDPKYTCHLREFDVTCRKNLKTVKLC